MLFSKGNLAVGRCASKNALDRGINCIRLNGDGSTVAMDQKVLIAVGPVDPGMERQFPEVGEQEKPPQDGVSISLSLLEDAKRNLPKDKRTSLQHVAMTKPRGNSKKIELTTTDMQSTKRVDGFPKPETFPPWKDIIRKVRGENPNRVCVNRQDMIELLTTLVEACPDKGGQNTVFLEINTAGNGIVMRCANRETGQRAIGALKAYNTDGQWLPTDDWEKEIFQTQSKVAKVVKIVKKEGGA